MNMYKQDLAFNNPQWLICYKTQSNQTIIFSNFNYAYILYAKNRAYLHSELAPYLKFYSCESNTYDFELHQNNQRKYEFGG